MESSANISSKLLQDRTNRIVNSGKKRGSNWNEKETRVMLEIATDMQITKLMDANRYRHIDIYKGIEKKLQEKGIHKSHEQIKLRVKKLKFSYINCKKENAPSGKGRTDIPFYDQLDLMYGRRPVVECNVDGVDTIEMNILDVQGVSEETEFDQNVIIDETEYPEVVTVVPDIAEEDLEALPNTLKETGKPRTERATGGRYTNNALLQNFALTMKKNCQELCDKMTQDHEKFIAKEMKKQRQWDIKLVKMQLKSQEMQTNKLINVLTQLKPQAKKQGNQISAADLAESESSEELNSTDLLDSSDTSDTNFC